MQALPLYFNVFKLPITEKKIDLQSWTAMAYVSAICHPARHPCGVLYVEFPCVLDMPIGACYPMVRPIHGGPPIRIQASAPGSRAKHMSRP